MDFPDWETPANAPDFSAVKLFLQSARRVQPNFSLEADSLTYLARICRQVQGMPLGIVLAAAWVDVLSLAEISAEIARSLDFLETEQHNVPIRQRSIHAVFDYSWNLLSGDEQTVFARLSYFRGGFTREAAQAVTGATLRTLAALVNKSMLRRNADTGRYEIHELLRQYAAQKLQESGDSEAVQQAHSRYYADQMEGYWLDLKGRNQGAALAAIDAEFSNLQLTWQYCVAHKEVDLLLKLGRPLWYFCDLRHRDQETWDMFDHALDAMRTLPADSGRDMVVGLFLGLRAWNASSLNDGPTAKTMCEEGIAILEQYTPGESLLTVLINVCGAVYLYFGDFSKTKQTVERARQLARVLNNRWEESRASFFGCEALATEGKWAEARQAAEETLAIALELGDVWQLGWIKDLMARTSLALNEFTAARHNAEQARQYFEEIDYGNGIGQCIRCLGDISLREQSYTDARRYFGQSLKMQKQRGEETSVLLDTVLKFVDLYIAQTRKEKALELLSCARLNASDHHAPYLDLVEQKRAELEAEFPPDTYAAIWEHGKALDFDKVVQDLIDESLA